MGLISEWQFWCSGLRAVEASGVPSGAAGSGRRHAMPSLGAVGSEWVDGDGFIRSDPSLLLRSREHGTERELWPGGGTILQRHTLPQLVGLLLFLWLRLRDKTTISSHLLLSPPGHCWWVLGRRLLTPSLLWLLPSWQLVWEFPWSSCWLVESGSASVKAREHPQPPTCQSTNHFTELPETVLMF